LLELLTAVAIISILLGLTLSAVQKIRAAADRAHCQNNLRQVGLALQHYHGSHDQFPPGVAADRPTEPQPFLSWCARLLPYLENDAMWRQIVVAFQTDRNFLKVPPHTALQTPIRHFACQSDDRVREARSLPDSDSLRAFTSYLGVNGLNSDRNDGILYLDSHVRLADVTDGTSSTLIVGERPPSHDLIFGWWYAGWGQDKNGEGDMVLGTRTWNVSAYGRGCPPGPYDYQSGRFDNQCDAFHFWSPHSGGANFLFADGSVRFLAYSANSVLPALASRASGEAVNPP
jgi:prepilin-type processing-associated H-X9-DG protein